MTKSSIEWTGHTWNPIIGCSIVSPGCTHCYAMKIAARIEAMGTAAHYRGMTRKVNGNAVWTGKVALAPDETLLAPLRRKKPTIYFVNSMGDLFHEDIPDDWIDRVFAVMALSPQHTFQVLTKRAKRMREYFAKPHSAPNIFLWQSSVCWAVDDLMPTRTDQSRSARNHVLHGALPNVWLGVSTERQQEYDERAPLLRDTPAAVRFFSMEPLLGPIVAPYLGDWVIVGGESGPGARPMHPDWARSLRDQCTTAGVPFFFKQWGEFADVSKHRPGSALHQRSTQDEIFTAAGDVLGVGYRHGRESNGIVEEGWREKGGAWMARVGKKLAGRTLDGVEYNGMPEARP